MKKVIASAGLLALGAVGVYSARADWAAGPDKPWTISGTLRGFYDNNINTQPDNTVIGGRPGKIVSTGYELSPKASFTYSDGPTSITTSYTYALQYYDSRPGNKADQSHDFEFAVNHAFNERYSAALSESFVDSQEPEVLSGGGAIGAPLRANGDNIRNEASITGNAQLTRLFGLLVGYSDTYYDYTGNTTGLAGFPDYGTLLNRFEHQVTLNTRWTVQPETVLIAGYQFLAVDYYSSGSLAPAGTPYISPKSRDNYTHNLYVGVEHSFTSQLSFSGRAGIQISDYYNEDEAPGGKSASDVGPFADLSFNYNYMDGGSLTIGFRQSKNQTDVGYDVSTASLTQDEESSTLYASVSQVLTPISPDLTLSVNGQYQNSVYNGGGFDNESDTYYLLGVNLTYQFTHYLSTEAGYNYDLINSDIAGRGYNRSRIYVGVTASY